MNQQNSSILSKRSFILGQTTKGATSFQHERMTVGTSWTPKCWIISFILLSSKLIFTILKSFSLLFSISHFKFRVLQAFTESEQNEITRGVLKSNLWVLNASRDLTSKTLEPGSSVDQLSILLIAAVCEDRSRRIAIGK